jgi:hypothetical protein
MTSKTPNLNKGRSAWARLAGIFHYTIPTSQGVITARKQQLIDLRKR